jgi:hypothetical protein
MGLKSTTVSRCLDKKLLFFGFELPDVLVIFLLLALLNLTLGQTEYKLALVWLPTLSLATLLRIAKRGKPDNFLVHWIRFKLRPRVLSAFPEPSVWISPPLLSSRKRL